jgi:hypothetical protein
MSSGFARTREYLFRYLLSMIVKLAVILSAAKNLCVAK